MKFCKDCKHFQNLNKSISGFVYDTQLMQCLSPMRPYDLVMGIQKKMSAEHSRNLAITGCGEVANWFEPIVEDADLDDLSTIPFGK